MPSFKSGDVVEIIEDIPWDENASPPIPFTKGTVITLTADADHNNRFLFRHDKWTTVPHFYGLKTSFLSVYPCQIRHIQIEVFQLGQTVRLKTTPDWEHPIPGYPKIPFKAGDIITLTRRIARKVWEFSSHQYPVDRAYYGHKNYKISTQLHIFESEIEPYIKVIQDDGFLQNTICYARA